MCTKKQFAKIFMVCLVLAFLISCQGVRQTTQASPSDSSTVVAVIPQANGVATNREVAVIFSAAMDPSSINSGTFAISGVSSAVTYDVTNRIAACKPFSDLAPNTAYNATITTGAKNAQGIPLAAPFAFSFTTRATSDTSVPTIALINIPAGATCVPVDTKVQVTFDEGVDSLSVNPSTFHIDGVTGAVSYNPISQIATFTPAASLEANTSYTITLTSGIKDLGGVPLAAFHSSFTTGPCQTGGNGVPLCPSPGNFAVLAGTTVTNTGSTTVAGDLGVSPGTAVTGFPPGLVSGTTHAADGVAAQAQADLITAFNDAAGRSGASSVSGDLGGLTLSPGVYKSTSGIGITGDVTLDAHGNPDAVFVFQISSMLITASGSHVVLTNSAKACNVFWQVGSSATLGTNSVFAGNILALTSIAVTTGAKFDGRALARNGSVTLDTNTINGCTCLP